MIRTRTDEEKAEQTKGVGANSSSICQKDASATEPSKTIGISFAIFTYDDNKAMDKIINYCKQAVSLIGMPECIGMFYHGNVLFMASSFDEKWNRFPVSQDTKGSILKD